MSDMCVNDSLFCVCLCVCVQDGSRNRALSVPLIVGIEYKNTNKKKKKSKSGIVLLTWGNDESKRGWLAGWLVGWFVALLLAFVYQFFELAGLVCFSESPSLLLSFVCLRATSTSQHHSSL